MTDNPRVHRGEDARTEEPGIWDNPVEQIEYLRGLLSQERERAERAEHERQVAVTFQADRIRERDEALARATRAEGDLAKISQIANQNFNRAERAEGERDEAIANCKDLGMIGEGSREAAESAEAALSECRGALEKIRSPLATGTVGTDAARSMRRIARAALTATERTK